jgi:glycosyltransferase involved in cell wall biosynthesis
VKPQISVVIPTYNEGRAIVGVLDRLLEEVHMPAEVLVVFDFAEDTTAPYLDEYARKEPRLAPTLNTYGHGPAHAIRFGIDRARADVVVVTMADGSDDPGLVESLARLVDQGAVVAAASRYSRGGKQIGGPLVKRTLSRLAGVSLYWLARVGTRDATNSFKAYSKSFIDDVGIDSRAGFEIGIELVAKARRLRKPVAELPATWHDRTSGESNFRILPWLPHYLRWYLFAFGRQLSLTEVREKMARTSQ